MGATKTNSTAWQPPPSAKDRLESWKEIANHFKRGVSTVQRWEREEGLPVHRHLHDKQGTVYAYRAELDAWWQNGQAGLKIAAPSVGKINWGRLFLCGVLTGCIRFSLGTFIMAFVGRDFVMEVVRHAQRPTSALSPDVVNLGIFFGWNLVIGLGMIWLYAVIRQRHGPGPKTASMVGLAFWFMGALVEVFFASYGWIPTMKFVAPLAASLPANVVATVVSDRYYVE